MARAQTLASTTRIDEVKDNSDPDGNLSDASSDLRLSYLDDVPLKQRFPQAKPPTKTTAMAPVLKPIPEKPLTITLPTPSSRQPTRSVTDILRELLQSEAAAFADALAESNITSQPSPPAAVTTSGDTTSASAPPLALATSLHSTTASHD